MSKRIVYKFRNKSFAAYGLDEEKNCLQAPVCECGCGGTCYTIMNDVEDLFGFIAGVLDANDCNHCAIFAHAYDDSMYVGIKYLEENDDGEEEVMIRFLKNNETDMGFFEEVDDAFEFHCYGLIIETRKGKWEVIEN